MAEQIDPFTTVYNKLWDVAEADPSLADLVRKGNRVKFCRSEADHDPRKFATTPGSTPELMLFPDSFTTELNFDNRQATVLRNWAWVIRVQDALINKNLFPLEFYLLRAMQVGRSSLLELKYDFGDGEINLIQRVSIDRGNLSIPDVQKETQNPMTRGWMSSWTISTLVNVPNPRRQ